MTPTKIFAAMLAMLGNVIAPFSVAGGQNAPITIEGERIFPESLDAGSDGTLYIGSVGKGAIFKVAPNSKANLWIEKAPNKLSAVTGVVVDETHGKLWVCSTDLNRLGEPVSLKVFDLGSGTLKADYPFPESKGLCNDIVVAKDGTAFVTDTNGARIFRLKTGAAALEQWVADPRFEGVDGIAFGPGGDILVNNVRTNLLFRIDLQADGSSGAIAQVMTSRPLNGPDGMRPTGDGRFVLTENRGGRVSIGAFDGDVLQIETLKEGLENPPGVTVAGNTIWFVEMKSKYRNDPDFKNKDPGPFLVTPIALPAKR
jgi:sugar lactone lactonase YvrE